MAAELGKLLHSARVNKGLSVEAVAEKTRISPKFINAVEAGEFEKLPGPVFIKGMLRSYASLIGLDGNEIVASYSGLNIITKSNAPALISMPLYKEHSPISKVGLFLAGIAIIVTVVAVYYYFGDTGLSGYGHSFNIARGGGVTNSGTVPFSDDKRGVESEAVTSDESVSGGEGPESPVEPAPAEETATQIGTDETTGEGVESSSEETVTGEPGVTTEITPPLSLAVTAIADSWIKIVLDSGEPREIILREGNTVSWQAFNYFILSIGNVAGVTLSLNNEPYKLEQPASNILRNFVIPAGVAPIEKPVTVEVKRADAEKPEAGVAETVKQVENAPMAEVPVETTQDKEEEKKEENEPNP